MTNLTAIVLSKDPLEITLPGMQVLNYVSTFDTLAGLHASRLAAVQQVKTDYCCFYDHDDELCKDPLPHIEAMLAMLVTSKANLAYSDWWQAAPDGDLYCIKPGVFDRQHYLTKVAKLHHLVMMRTSVAQAIAAKLPQGTYWTEFMLWFGLTAVPPVYYQAPIYVYNKGTTGFHTAKDITKAQMNSVLWALQQLW